MCPHVRTLHPTLLLAPHSRLYGLTGVGRNLQPHYNIAPTDPVDVARPAASNTADLVTMR
jgi:putative SOS response-associated peptidase YedK